METAFLYAYGYHVFSNQKELYKLFQKILSVDNSELLIRLYKKYVRKEDVNETLNRLIIVQKSENVFSKKEKQLINKLIEVYQNVTEGSEYSFQKHPDWGYKPVRLVIFDEPYSSMMNYFPLEDFENNEGEPLWMRPEYISPRFKEISANWGK